MNENEFLLLIEKNPEILLYGFKKEWPGFSKEIVDYTDEVDLGLFRTKYAMFEECRQYILGGRGSWLACNTLVSEIKFELECRAELDDKEEREYFLGVVMLALVSLGYKLRRCRRSFNGSVAKRPPRIPRKNEPTA